MLCSSFRSSFEAAGKTFGGRLILPASMQQHRFLPLQKEAATEVEKVARAEGKSAADNTLWPLLRSGQHNARPSPWPFRNHEPQRLFVPFVVPAPAPSALVALPLYETPLDCTFCRVYDAKPRRRAWGRRRRRARARSGGRSNSDRVPTSDNGEGRGRRGRGLR